MTSHRVYWRQVGEGDGNWHAFRRKGIYRRGAMALNWNSACEQHALDSIGGNARPEPAPADRCPTCREVLLGGRIVVRRPKAQDVSR